MKTGLLFTFFAAIAVVACFAKLTVRTAANAEPNFQDLKDGEAFCTEPYGTVGFTVICTPTVSAAKAKFTVTAEATNTVVHTRTEYSAPYTINGDSNGFFAKWNPPSGAVRIVCEAQNAQGFVLETIAATVTFTCNTMPATPTPPPATTTTATTPTKYIPVDSKYCVTIPAQRHVNPRPAAWTEDGSALVSWADDGRAGQIYTNTTLARLEYTFTVPIESVYAITMVSTTFDATEHNDGWCGLENEPIRLVQYVNGVQTGNLVRSTMQKAYQNTANLAKAMFSIDNSGHSFSTAKKLQPGVTYKLLFSGRSTQFKLNGLILFPCDEIQCWHWNPHFQNYLGVCNL